MAVEIDWNNSLEHLTRDQLADEIKRFEQVMRDRAMSDDFYYTNGRRKADATYLHAMRDEYARRPT